MPEPKRIELRLDDKGTKAYLDTQGVVVENLVHGTWLRFRWADWDRLREYVRRHQGRCRPQP